MRVSSLPVSESESIIERFFSGHKSEPSSVVRLTFTETKVGNRRTEMPLKVKRFYTSIFTISIGFAGGALAQTTPSTPQQQTAAVPQTAAVRPTTSAEVMRDRISKAKAYIAVRNYSAAIYELENIRRETSDLAVHAVANVLLMNSYVEQGEYKRAENF